MDTPLLVSLLVIGITSIFRAAYADQHDTSQYVYKVRASGCIQGGERALTGFLVPLEGGLITALHGVAGCDNIRALNARGRSFRELRISKVDLALDVALLTSSDLESAIRMNPDQGLTTSNDQTESIHVIGFPLDLGEHVETVNIRIEGTKPLVNLIPPSELENFAECASPDLGIQVLSLEGTIRPGESGAPIFNERGEVIAIGMGGLDEGRVAIVWASRWQDVALVNATIVDDELHERAQKYCLTNRFAELGEATSGPAAPEVRIHADKTSGQRPLVVNFSAEVSGEAERYQWDFGDGASSQKRNRLHTFSKIGVFRVRLIAAGPGGEDSDEIQISTVVVPTEAFRISLGGSMGSFNIDARGKIAELDKLGQAFDSWDTGNNSFSYTLIPTTPKERFTAFQSGEINLYLGRVSDIEGLRTSLTVQPWDRLINLAMYPKDTLLQVSDASGRLETIGIPHDGKFFVIPSHVSGASLEAIGSFIAWLAVLSNE